MKAASECQPIFSKSTSNLVVQLEMYVDILSAFTHTLCVVILGTLGGLFRD